ncbi:MAG TPA: ABC transporter permease [Thermomicrobiales bacterium]|nr:ABC transporter permease [Thermomicrobiales bacterium]
MKPLGYMLRANLKMSFRNRTALFWNLAFPLIFILLFGFLFRGGDISLRVGVAGHDASDIAGSIVADMQAAEGFDATIGSAHDELRALQDGDRNVVVVFDALSDERVRASVYWDESDPQFGQIALSAVRQYLLEANVAFSEDGGPIDIDVQAIQATGIEYIDFLVPGILAMSLMNSGMIGLASAFVTYREKGILRRIRATPFPLSSFITARILSQLVISVAQAVVLVSVGILAVGLTVRGNLLNVLVMVIIGSLGFLSLGFVISAFARNQETADSLANGISFPMLFLSGVFFPIDAAPGWLQPIMRIMPLRYLVDGLRNLMVRDGTLPEQWLNILVMLATGVVGFLLAVRFFRWESSAS